MVCLLFFLPWTIIMSFNWERNWILESESEFSIAFYWSVSYVCVCVCRSFWILMKIKIKFKVEVRRNTIWVTKCELEKLAKCTCYIVCFSFGQCCLLYKKHLCFFLYRLIDRIEIDKKKTNDCFCCGLCALVLTVWFFFLLDHFNLTHSALFIYLFVHFFLSNTPY